MTNITRWNHDISRAETRFARLFDEAFRGMSAPGCEEQSGLTPCAPAVDIYEKDLALVVAVELPGVKAQEVNVTLENNVLTIQGERKLEGEVQRDTYHRRECAHGSFSRSFTLPPHYDTQNVQAQFVDGVLRITVPRSEKARPRQISIGAGSTPQLAREAMTTRQEDVDVRTEGEELTSSRR